ncbi:50S ribosomal protein L20, putative [Pediculus humanus corporis]|uniref:50S ribosomal protein L20, putative n=1 Tax=Pediculus humanus subsp. corporis TaxID=121224 RepID=E0VX58_PEDHC|nr:50S ribosomal protein L20, putative [Pediculus humanus corporis]EEB17964.1 50S ribosomal protein L20, putative [Pediculus humanus corporis]
MVFQTPCLFQKILHVKPFAGTDRFWRKRKILKFAAHFVGRHQNCYSIAIRRVIRALTNSCKSRNVKNEVRKELIQTRLNAACEEHGLPYPYLKESLIRSNILLNKKILVDLAIWEPRTFKSITYFAWNKAKAEGLEGINELEEPPSGVKSYWPVQTTHFARKVLGFSSIFLSLAKCEEEINSSQSKVNNLSHEHCIKQACLLSVNSASTLLTTTASALIDICNSYKESLNQMLSLLEEVQAFDGILKTFKRNQNTYHNFWNNRKINLNLSFVAGDNPLLWDAIVETRAKVNKAKAAVNELNSYMSSVEKVVTSTTEAAFLAGAEYMCTALCERLESAQREIKIQIGHIKKLEDDYLRMQQEIVSNKQNNKNKEDKKIVDVSKNGNFLNYLSE